MQVKFFHNIAAVYINPAGGNEKALGNHWGGTTFRQKL